MTVRFSHYPEEYSIGFKPASAFGSSYLNQLKASLVLRDKSSVSNFNRLSKEQTIKLQSLAISGSAQWSQIQELLDFDIWKELEPTGKQAIRFHHWNGVCLDSLTTSCEPELTLEEFVRSFSGSVIQVICQGCIVPLDTPLGWLHRHAAALDGWLHLCAITL